MAKTETVMDNARKMGDDVMKFGRNVWLAGLGAVAIAAEETGSVFDKLVDRGEKFRKSERNYLGKAFDDASDRAKKIGSKVESSVQSTMSSVLHRTGVPSRDEVRKLIRRVEELNSKVEKLATH